MTHFGASILEKEGVPITTIQELLGHLNRTTTEIYLHSFEGSNLDAIEKLGDALNSNGESGFLRKSPTKTKGLQLLSHNPLIFMVRQAGLEPATYGLEGLGSG